MENKETLNTLKSILKDVQFEYRYIKVSNLDIWLKEQAIKEGYSLDTTVIVRIGTILPRIMGKTIEGKDL